MQSFLKSFLVANLSSAAQCGFNSRLYEASIHQQPGQYLDLKNPLDCSGNLTGWHFCFYAAATPLSPNTSYWVWFQIWREVGNSFQLQKVFNHQVQFSGFTSNNDTFVCREIVVSNSESFSVQVGDLLGVYLPVSPERPIPVIGWDMNIIHSIFYNCRDYNTAFMNETIDINSLENQTGLIIHIDAIIGNFYHYAT